MELALVIAVYVVFAIATMLWGVDSRPGFDGGRSAYKERWFIHSRTD